MLCPPFMKLDFCRVVASDCIHFGYLYLIHFIALA